MTNLSSVQVGSTVHLRHEDDCIVPPGPHAVSKINPDGSFHLGGRTAVWPRRVVAVDRADHPSDPTTAPWPLGGVNV